MNEPIRHTFVVCAYRESRYLEDCIRSLTAQTVPSRVLVATSTPNDYIRGIAERYGLPVFVNEGEAGITGDWNFGLSCAESEYVTLAHQDDVYDPTYVERILARAERVKRPVILFTEYYEIRNGEKVLNNKLLRTKRKMNFFFRPFPNSRWMRRRILSVGNPICCPAVTYCKAACADLKFDGNFRFACDWDAWERLSRKKGAFCYIRTPLMGHRIHEESTTTEMTNSTRRAEEETAMFRRFWPKWIARFIMRFYSRAADSNKIEPAAEKEKDGND